MRTFQKNQETFRPGLPKQFAHCCSVRIVFYRNIPGRQSRSKLRPHNNQPVEPQTEGKLKNTAMVTAGRLAKLFHISQNRHLMRCLHPGKITQSRFHARGIGIVSIRYHTVTLRFDQT